MVHQHRAAEGGQHHGEVARQRRERLEQEERELEERRAQRLREEQEERERLEAEFRQKQASLQKKLESAGLGFGTAGPIAQGIASLSASGIGAGAGGMAGAAVLAGLGALRAGAGMAALVSPAANREILQTALPEALYVDRGSLEPDFLAGSKAAVVGPGMGTDDEALDLLRTIAKQSDVPLVLDADAVTLLAGNPELRDAIGDRPLVLTPHPGEMSRLLSIPADEVTADPFGAAALAAERFTCTVLLKGAPSLVATRGRATLVNVAGHSGLATGGNGDVLSGVVGAFLARGMEPADAAGAALWFAGRAAELAGRGSGLLPRDVADALPAALLEAPASESALGLPGIVLDLPRAR